MIGGDDCDDDDKTIAEALGIADGTVKQHLKSIFKRLDVKNRTQAIRAAQKMGLIEKSDSNLTRVKWLDHWLVHRHRNVL